MRVNLYTINYQDGATFSHYDLNKVIDEMNAYNAIHYPQNTMSLTKIRRYLLGKSHIPKPYKNITKKRLNEIIGVDNLSQVNYGAVYHNFVKTNTYSNTELIAPPSSPMTFL